MILVLLAGPLTCGVHADNARLAAGKFEFGGGMLLNFGRMAYGNNVVGLGEVDYAAVETTIGYFITQGFEFQGGLGMGWLHLDEFGYSQNAIMLDGGPTFNIETGSRLVPYTFARFGLGSFSRSYEGTPETVAYSNTDNGAFLRFGGGARIFAADDWNIKVEVRSDKAFIEDAQVTTSVMLYLSWLYGR
jgi:hypothetical protein